MPNDKAREVLVRKDLMITAEQYQFYKDEKLNLSQIMRELLQTDMLHRQGIVDATKAIQRQRDNQSEINQLQAALNYLEGKGFDANDLRQSGILDRKPSTHAEKDQLIDEVRAKLTALQSRDGMNP